MPPVKKYEHMDSSFSPDCSSVILLGMCSVRQPRPLGEHRCAVSGEPCAPRSIGIFAPVDDSMMSLSSSSSTSSHEDLVYPYMLLVAPHSACLVENTHIGGLSLKVAGLAMSEHSACTTPNEFDSARLVGERTNLSDTPVTSPTPASTLLSTSYQRYTSSTHSAADSAQCRDHSDCSPIPEHTLLRDLPHFIRTLILLRTDAIHRATPTDGLDLLISNAFLGNPLDAASCYWYHAVQKEEIGWTAEAWPTPTHSSPQRHARKDAAKPCWRIIGFPWSFDTWSLSHQQLDVSTNVEKRICFYDYRCAFIKGRSNGREGGRRNQR